MRSIARCAFALLSLGLLTGCAVTPYRVVTAGELCQDWRHKTVSKDDKLTEKTASDLEADNKSRPAWGCAYGKNEAAKS